MNEIRYPRVRASVGLYGMKLNSSRVTREQCSSCDKPFTNFDEANIILRENTPVTEHIT